MNRFAQRLFAFVQDSLGLDRLGSNFKRFAVMHFGFVIFTSSYSIFINTLFMRCLLYTSKALRTVMRAGANRINQKIMVEID